MKRMTRDQSYALFLLLALESAGLLSAEVFAALVSCSRGEELTPPQRRALGRARSRFAAHTKRLH